MVKTLLMSAAISGLMITGALAQATPGDVPKADAPKADVPKAADVPKVGDAKAGDTAKFVSSQMPDQWVFSKFKGTDVIGPMNENIGGVNDVLFDKNGKIMAVIVGVGGFLGIGQKNVAMDMSAFQVVPATTGTTSTSSSEDPTNVKLKVAWTKDELMKAPDFQYYKAPPATTTGIGQRPATPPPPAPPPPRP